MFKKIDPLLIKLLKIMGLGAVIIALHLALVGISPRIYPVLLLFIIASFIVGSIVLVANKLIRWAMS